MYLNNFKIIHLSWASCLWKCKICVCNFYIALYCKLNTFFQVDSLKLVSLPRRLQSDENFSLFAPTPPAEGRDKGGTTTPSEWGKLVGFLDREASQFVATHGLQIPLPNWAANLPLLFFKVYQSPAHPSPRSGNQKQTKYRRPSDGFRRVCNTC